MRIICAPSDFAFSSTPGDLDVVLYDRPKRKRQGSVGAAVRESMRRHKFAPALRAWDFTTIALSVMAADLAGQRDRSPDGWTREFDLHIAVADQPFWSTQVPLLEELLGFLTTDRWQLHFLTSGILPAPDREPVLPDCDSVVLLSGGLDSLVGAIDLVSRGKKPFAVSQSVRGDEETQDEFAAAIGAGLQHIRLNHNADVPIPEAMPSQRARSIIFLAYGVMMATATARYHAGEPITLYLCENGFISINPPLTSARLGSLSTRTSHPFYLAKVQEVLRNAGLRVTIENPYQYKTKGEMLVDCFDQELLKVHAHLSTSCGRFRRFNYRHCGRCVPCLIRRAAFQRWGIADKTKYVFRKLSIDDKQHARSDDVRSAAMAVAMVEENGVEPLIGATLSFPVLGDVTALKAVVRRGVAELRAFLGVQGVQ
ncbi:MAG TPA: Qat anti-phage system QueC-like protein QatC [Xanthobacteraceae bacterium]|jgi:7-cyano-7-deazaguanine synthase in queuosine biosynthesis|nr:Qat anti-phage system QueC-like protein QatC [Xanthobacteraceae bacterium]